MTGTNAPRVSPQGPGRYGPDARTTHVWVPPTALPETCGALALGGARLVVMTATDERPLGRGFGLYYVFARSSGDYVAVCAMLDPAHPSFPSVTPLVPAAHWYEREAKDLFGLDPQGHPDPRRLVLHPDWPHGVHPLRKDFAGSTRVPRVVHDDVTMTGVHGQGVIEIPVGPVHAGIIEPGHFRFGGVGELVLDLEARLFYTHRGIEKSVEGRSVERALVLAERICGVCSVSHAVAFSQAIESLAGAQPTRRAHLVRSVFLELERLYNHVGDLANLCAGASLQLGLYQGGVLKERFQELNGNVGGHRYLFGIVTPGGVRRDLDPTARQTIARTLDMLEPQFDGFVDGLLDTDSFMERLIGTGTLDHDLAVSLGAVGIAARASGVARDVRHDHPYAAYGPGSVVPITRAEGDVRARMLVRIDEARASFGLIRGFLRELAELA
ncbi:MAG TPA: NADH-quinone oxidoreductase subunit C, partial [Candidatus Limnocylindria bacterium]